MKLEDFPAGTMFFIKGDDGPYAIFPGPRPIKFRTFSFASGAKGSSAATGVTLRGFDVSIEEFLAEVEHYVREAASQSKLLTLEEREAALYAEIDAHLAKTRALIGTVPRSDDGDFMFAHRGDDGLPDPNAD